MIENEKTYLVLRSPNNFDQYPGERIRQAYLHPYPNNLRIREYQGRFELTKKIPKTVDGDRVVREKTIPLEQDQFECLWLRANRSLEKTRHRIPLEDGLVAELDIFGGPLTGLELVDVEFRSTRQKLAFADNKPVWIGRDVTDEEFSSNSFLAGRSFEEIDRLIKKFLGT